MNGRDYHPSCLEMESPASCSHSEHGSTTYPVAVTLCRAVLLAIDQKVLAAPSVADLGVGGRL